MWVSSCCPGGRGKTFLFSRPYIAGSTNSTARTWAFDCFLYEVGMMTWHAYLLCMICWAAHVCMMVPLAAEGNIELWRSSPTLRENWWCFFFVFTPFLSIDRYLDWVVITVQLDVKRYPSWDRHAYKNQISVAFFNNFGQSSLDFSVLMLWLLKVFSSMSETRENRSINKEKKLWLR